MNNKQQSFQELASNRKAFHNYEILETFEAGLALLGSEVKSIRNRSASLQESYVVFSDNAAILKNASIAPYSHAGSFPHEERRNRKLLLHKNEITKLRKYAEEKGLTIIPLSLYLKAGLIKIKIAVAKGKKEYDKREAIKKREEDKRIQRIMRNH